MPQLFPTLNAAAVDTSISNPQPVAPPVTWGVAPLFDFESNKFLFTDSGDLLLGNEATTLSQRITAALITPRFVYRIHGSWFGSDFELLLGKNYPKDVLKKLGESMTRAAVQDSRIMTIRDLVTDVQDGRLVVSFSIVAVGGYKEQFEGVWRV